MMKKQTTMLAFVLLFSLCIQSYNVQTNKKSIAKSMELTEGPVTENSDKVTDCAVIQKIIKTKNNTAKAGKGDLSIFNLYGPVKSCIYEDEEEDGEYYHREFDKNGRLVSENGDKLSEIYKGKVKRNKEGRIIYGDKGHGKIRYEYDKNGFMKKILWTEDADGKEYTSCRKFFYNKRGLVIRIEWETGDFPPTTFKILKTDKYGNWIQRKDNNGIVTFQKITYYK